MHGHCGLTAIQKDLEVRAFARFERCSLICQPTLKLAALHAQLVYTILFIFGFVRGVGRYSLGEPAISHFGYYDGRMKSVDKKVRDWPFIVGAFIGSNLGWAWRGFHTGRTPDWPTIVADEAGAITGLATVWLCLYLWRRRRSRLMQTTVDEPQ